MIYLVTGGNGFIGRNLRAHLSEIEDVEVYSYDLGNTQEQLGQWLSECDAIFHLAGVNRPESLEDYETGNAGFTSEICNILTQMKRTPPIVMTSSIQAEQDNPYGISKQHAEDALAGFHDATGASVATLRLKNVFGKWCRPNYNSVTATFCHNIAHDLPITISNPEAEVTLVHVDDVVETLIGAIEGLAENGGAGTDPSTRVVTEDTTPTYTVTLGDLAGRIQSFREMQESLLIPDFSVRFNQQLYTTFLSYREPTQWIYQLTKREDPRGDLAEFVKSTAFGQIFVSRTHPGITRGNHYHHIKSEKFLVIGGKGLIRFRHIEGGDIIEFPVKGEDYQVVDIPPGYTHSITNMGAGEMITLFWASEVFDPDRPDTFYLEV